MEAEEAAEPLVEMYVCPVVLGFRALGCAWDKQGVVV